LDKQSKLDSPKASLPSLWGLPTISPTFFVIKSSSIIAVTTTAMSYISRPMPSYILSIYPHLTFPHATHI
jgi:hypothetical protein